MICATGASIVVSAIGCVNGTVSQGHTPDSVGVDIAQELVASVPTFKVVTRFDVEQDSDRTVAYFVDSHVVEITNTLEEAEAIYDLDAMSWRLIDSTQSTTLSNCNAWAASSVVFYDAVLDEMPDGDQKRFIESYIHPDLAVESTEDGFTLEHEFTQYTVSLSQSYPAGQISRMVSWYKLNACRRAMDEQQFPPFVTLILADELESRQIFPGRMDVRVKTQTDEAEIRLIIDIEDMTESEQEMVRAFLYD